MEPGQFVYVLWVKLQFGEKFSTNLLRKDSFISPISIFKKSTSTLITPYKNFNDHVSAELQVSY